nr:reverse transcriptase domain-containing protein [Tanacetum cinerariifolium]
MKVVNDKFHKLYVDFVVMALHLEEKFYPHLLTTIVGCRWLLTHGMELAIVNYLSSPEYLFAHGAAIGRVLIDVDAYNPSAEVDYIFALQQLQNVNFSLLARLKSDKDASVETVMDILRLEGPLAEKLGLNELQPNTDQLMVPIHCSPDQVVVGATALSLALNVSSVCVWKIRENIANQRSALRDVFVSLAEPFSVVVLTCTEGTSDTPNEVSTSSSDQEIIALKAKMAGINKNLIKVLQVNKQVKAVTPSCETYGGPHSYNDCLATVGQTQNVYAAGAYEGGHSYQPQCNRNLLSYHSDNYLVPPGFNQNQNFQNQNRNQGHNHGIPQGNNQGRNQFFQGASHSQNPPPAYQVSAYQAPGTLPSNTITNPKEDLKGITTRSGNAYQGPTIPTTSSSLPKVVERETEVTMDTVPPINNEAPKTSNLRLSKLKLLPNFEPVVSPVIAPTGKALIDVYEGELTLRVCKEAITFNLDQTSRYSANYNDMTANQIDVIDMACEEYSQKVLGFSDVIASGNPTPYYDPVVSTFSLTLTPFGDSDFLLGEFNAFLALEDDPTSREVDHSYYDPEGNILLLEAFLNDDPSLPLSNQGMYLPQVRKELKICEAKNDKSSIDELIGFFTASIYIYIYKIVI